MFRNAGYWMAGIFVLTLVAFWPHYIAGTPVGGSNPYFHVHAAVMTLWFGMLIVQPFLVRAGRRPLHRALGKLSYVLAPAILVAAVLLAHARLPPPSDPGFPMVAMFTFLPISMLLLFELAYVLAIVYRKTQALHARYMLATTLALVDPIASRLLDFYVLDQNGWFVRMRLEQAVSWLVAAVIMGWCIIRERDQRVGRSAFPIMLGATTVVYLAWFFFAPTETWLAAMRWFQRVPLT